MSMKHVLAEEYQSLLRDAKKRGMEVRSSRKDITDIGEMSVSAEGSCEIRIREPGLVDFDVLADFVRATSVPIRPDSRPLRIFMKMNFPCLFGKDENVIEDISESYGCRDEFFVTRLPGDRLWRVMLSEYGCFMKNDEVLSYSLVSPGRIEQAAKVCKYKGGPARYENKPRIGANIYDISIRKEKYFTDFMGLVFPEWHQK